MAKPKLRFSEFTSEWKEYKVNQIFDRIINPVTIEKDKYYKQIGIRSHGKGIFYKEEVTGEELGNKRVFWIEPDCFVVNVVFAWERAVAKLTEAERGMIASHRFPMYKPKDKVLDLDYITMYFTTFYGQKILILASPGGAGRNKTLGQDEFLNSRIRLPSFDEQKKIANFLYSLEELIKIQEDEILSLKYQKKGVMQKLFNYEVRFKANDGSEYPEWEEKTFDEVFFIVQNNTFSRNCLNITDGKVINIHYGDILTKYGSCIDLREQKAVFINTNIPLNKFDEKSYLCNGDIIISDTAEDTSVGKATEINGVVGKKVLSGLHTIPCRPKMVFAPKYLGYYINSEKYHNQLIPLIQGIKVSSISKTNIRKTVIAYPCLEEQKKIADCLSAYDEIIQLKKEKLDIWKKIKKGLLQQMFM